MLEGQFYIRLLLNVIVGVMFAYALFKMAQHNNHETDVRPHKVLHVVGWIFICFSVICLLSCIYYLTLVDFPDEMIIPFVGANTIVRPSSAVCIWGQPTMIQNMTLTMAMSAFDSLGIGAYFLYFKSSNSSWWKKIVKFFVVVLLYAFMASATKFNYFDTPELVAPVLFFILWLSIIRRGDIPKKSEIINEEMTLPKGNMSLEICKSETENNTINESTPKEETVIIEEEKADKSDNATLVSDIGSEKMQYCRYCGKKIEEDSAYCKYCGCRIDNNDGKISKYHSIISKCKNVLLLCSNSVAHFFKKLRLSTNRVSVSKGKTSKVLKKIGEIVLGLIALVVVGGGIWLYFDVFRPEQKSAKIFNTEKENIDKLEGVVLYQKCNDIIRNHDIPSCGKEWRDHDNLRELSDYAWGKIEKLAYQGNSDAQFLLGLKYGGYDFLFGKWELRKFRDGSFYNEDLDYDKAAYWFLRAAEQGHGRAQAYLGRCFELGYGVVKNMEEAIRWYRLSTVEGDDKGELHLGDCFRDGYSVQDGTVWRKDPDCYWCKYTHKCTEHTYPSYRTALEANIDSAKYYWQKSAVQGNETAKERLQKIYLKGNHRNNED